MKTCNKPTPRIDQDKIIPFQVPSQVLNDSKSKFGEEVIDIFVNYRRPCKKGRELEDLSLDLKFEAAMTTLEVLEETSPKQEDGLSPMELFNFSLIVSSVLRKEVSNDNF